VFLNFFMLNLCKYNLSDNLNSVYYVKKLNSKAIPLQAWTGPVGSRRPRLTDFKTIDT